MSRRDDYPAGVPCFVDTLTPDIEAALGFYGTIFGWEFDGPGPMPGDPPGSYYVAHLDGDDVAGATVLVEPFDAAPAGRMAVLADPAGAGFVVWEAGVRAGASRVNEPSAWAMSLLTTPDPQGAREFYGALFGWQAEEFGPSLWLWRLPGYVGGEPQQPVPRDVIAAMTAGDTGSAAWSVDFWIADADAAARLAPQAGGTVVAEPFTESMFRRTILAAPDGATFSVSQLQAGG